jgi:hypothetical protein
MKKCPICGKTFDDNMRFCQTDGTPLVAAEPDTGAVTPTVAAAPPAAEPPTVEEPEFDPFATIVGVPKSAIPPPETLGEPLDISPSGTISLEPAAPADAGPASSADAGPVAGESSSSIPVAPPDDILDLGENDPLKTMYVSDTEMKEVLGTASQGAETPAEEIRADEEQTLISSNMAGTDFGSISPPPSPFSAPTPPEDTPVPAPPSFLDAPPAAAPSEAETQTKEPERPYQDAETVFQSQPEPPQFNQPAPAPLQNQEWNPPPAPTPEWQNQQIGSNTPFQPPPAGAGAGQNKTLAIISLVLGILSVCCYIAPATGIAALVTGFMATKKANQDPQNYGGKGLALAGMICGGVFFLIGVAYWIYIIVVIGFVGLSSLAR